MDHLQLEEWRPIKGHEGRKYACSRGRVKSLARSRALGARSVAMSETIMKQHVHINGYMVVWLRRPGEHIKHFAHRLVADAFIPNPDAKSVVNHRDRNKQHNHLANLEWMSFKENTHHWMQDDLARSSTVAASDMATIADADLPF